MCTDADASAIVMSISTHNMPVYDKEHALKLLSPEAFLFSSRLPIRCYWRRLRIDERNEEEGREGVKGR